MNIQFHELPADVREMARDEDEWELQDPSDIRVDECMICGDDLYYVDPAEDVDSCPFCGDPTCPINEWGEQTHAEYVYDDGLYGTFDDDGVVCGGCYEGFDYDANTAIVVTPEGRAKVEYTSGVYRDFGRFGGEFEHFDELPHGEEIVEAIVEGTGTVRVDGWRSYEDGPSEANGLEKLGTGWHSSMERSDQSDAINALTSGEIRVEFPVAVVFTRSSNAFSQPIDVYAPPEHKDELVDILAGNAAPVHGGVEF